MAVRKMSGIKVLSGPDVTVVSVDFRRFADQPPMLQTERDVSQTIRAAVA
jgi:hypothetical protein